MSYIEKSLYQKDFSDTATPVYCAAGQKTRLKVIDPQRRRANVPVQFKTMGSVLMGQLCAQECTTLSNASLAAVLPQHDGFMVCLLSHGSAQLMQSGHCTRQYAGDILIIDREQAFQYTLATYCQGVVILLSKMHLCARIADADTMTAKCFSASEQLIRFSSGMLLSMADLNLESTSTAAHHLATSIINLLAATMESQAGDRHCAKRAGLLDTAKSLMLANIDNPDIDIDSVARQTGVSRRTLNRLFAAQDTTPSRWLLKKRLELSKSLLQNGSIQRVTDAAMQCGFSDFSHFSRAFKNQFGITPKSLLLPALAS